MSPRLLVLRPGAIGDTLLTASALSALRLHYPLHSIQVAGNQYALPVLAAMGLADAWTAFDHPSVTRLFMAGDPAPDDPFLGVDVGVAWCADPDGVLATSLRRRSARDVVIARSRPEPGDIVHVARHLVRTLAPLGIDGDAPHGIDSDAPLDVPQVRLTHETDVEVNRILADHDLAPGRFIVVHPGSGSPAKNWPPERFAELIERLEADAGLPTVLLSGPADTETVGRVKSALHRPVPVLSDRSFASLSQLLGAAALFLGNDSGLSHLAGIVGCPTLTLFGPTDPALWAPLGPNVRVIRHQPLTDLSTDIVLREIHSLLDL